ncbi:MAG: hypothetical protein HQ522_13290 [Bacteroidetes bacterium]|nr:hypothetical protein [Bacteroidota bacterium]
MKNLVALLFITFLIAPFFNKAQGQLAPNLVPAEAGKAPNYWCTWYWQNYHIKQWVPVTDPSASKIFTNRAAREELNEELLLGEKGWARVLLPKTRSDYYFLIDHGWQDKTIKEAPFLSLIMDTNDFPSFANLEPLERIKRLNDKIKQLGWRGLGLWVRGNVSENEMRKFVQWSKYAGVEYWKIDGGDTKFYYATKVKKEIYPELTLEHVTGAGPLTKHWDEKGRVSYPSIYQPEINDNKQRTNDPASVKVLEILKNTDVFRTYDAAPLTVSATTLQRVHDILSQSAGHPEYTATLNIQDDSNIAAALGLLVAVKRHPMNDSRMYKGEDLHFQIRGNRHVDKRMNEMDRMVLWQRIALPMPAGYGTYQASENFLVDSIVFQAGDTWYDSSIGKMVHQSAPAVMARNISLPTVECEGAKPYVLASKFPNGAVCIATEGRVKPEESWFYPRANVCLNVGSDDVLIGVFGHYKTLSLQFDHKLSKNATVWAQDLLAEKAVDISSLVSVKKNRLIIPGEVIDKFGTIAGDKGDISVPGLVIKIE